MPRAGDYWTQVTMRNAVFNTDAYGDRTPTSYTDGPVYWADIEFDTAAETDRAGAKRHVIKGKFTLGDYLDIDPRDRVNYLGDDYEITGVTFGYLQTILFVESVL